MMETIGCKRGFMMVMVLFITFVGLLIGAGALLSFRNQCQLRIEREHELEKVYAVRSVLDYLRFNFSSVNGKRFRYHTRSGRNLNLELRHVDRTFPCAVDDFDIGKSGAFDAGECSNQWNEQYRYEYGAEGLTNGAPIGIGQENFEKTCGLSFNDSAATNTIVWVSDELSITNKVKWWVNFSMPSSNSWLQAEFGSRYYFYPRKYIKGTSQRDTLRLCIIRDITNETNQAGRRHGWPLSQRGERALVLQITPSLKTDSDNDSGASVSLLSYLHDGSQVCASTIWMTNNWASMCRMGIQIAGKYASVFQVPNYNYDIESLGFVFSEVCALDDDIVRYFGSEVTIGSNTIDRNNRKTYGGMETDDAGNIKAPALRAVIEVQAADGLRGGGANDFKSNYVTEFRALPAYQYEVWMEHEIWVDNVAAHVNNRATVAQKLIRVDPEVKLKVDYMMRTYDTHGTEHKGFVRDEHEQQHKIRDEH